MNRSTAATPFFASPPEALYERLGTSVGGLSQAEAARRLAARGPGHVDDGARQSGPRLLLRQFESPLVLILVAGAGVSALLRDWIDAAIIVAIVLGSTLLGFLQEYRASQAIAGLRQRLALRARVRRDGELASVPVAELVPGDIIELAAGNLVPADGLVLEAKDFLVSEAALTGESFPVEKQPGVVDAAVSLAKRTNAVYQGSSVRSGTARVLVAATGADTVFGAVAARLRTRAPETAFAHGVRQFGAMLLRVMFVVVIFVLTANFLLGRPVADSLLFAVALAVGLSPELLPVIVTVTLAAGARTLARRGVIVRRLDAIENLGSIDILCTDKTGTLTEAAVVLHASLDGDGAESPQVRRLAFLNAMLETGIENPLDEAIVAAGNALAMDLGDARKIDEIPYDFLRRRLTIVVAEAGDAERHLMITKGAVAGVLAACATVRRGGVESALTEAERHALDEAFRRSSGEGFRVLGLASRRLPAQARYERADERDMTFDGFLLFRDPPKAGIEVTLRDLHDLGIGIKIITGDNRHVTRHLAAAVGLDPDSILTGEDLAAMRDEALWQRARGTALFVEVDPQQKERIVRALQRTGHVVGYLGDGINDAPALHAADVGISVDGAVDVARESADVILLQRDLEVLCRGVRDGRRTFANTLKYIAITTSANFGNMLSMALATPLLPFLPLLPKQILLNNFLSDIPALAIAGDNVDAARLDRAQHWDVGRVQRFMVVFGLLSSAFDLLTFVALWWLFRAGEVEFQTAWFVVSLLTELTVALVLRTQESVLRSRPSSILLAASVAVCVVAVLLPGAGAVAALFGLVPLPWYLWAFVAAVVLGYVATTEAVKRWFYRPQPRRG